jgi:tRNA threonylcarbamoyladenosine dehydratase
MKSKMFERNIGFISEKDQEKISKLSVAIAGAGGDGGLLAERLVRFGIGKIVLADPEIFEVQNINRQFASNSESMGKNKAETVAKELKLINPKLKIKVYNKGINEKNVTEFVQEADIIVDEIEYSFPEISVILAKEARSQNKYVFMGANVGWGASAFCFSPKGMSFEEYFEYDLVKKTINPLKYLDGIPKYFSKKLLTEVLEGEVPMPSLSSSVGLVASIVSSQIILFAIKKKKPVLVPQILFFDTYYL